MRQNRRRFAAAYVLLVLFAGVALGTFVAVNGDNASAAVRYTKAAPEAPPTAQMFEGTLAGTANVYAVSHNDPRRIQHVHCVPGHRGHYMCVYTVVAPSRAPECHLVQAEWTGGALASYRIVLSGRARRCDSVRSAVQSLD